MHCVRSTVCFAASLPLKALPCPHRPDNPCACSSPAGSRRLPIPCNPRIDSGWPGAGKWPIPCNHHKGKQVIDWRALCDKSQRELEAEWSNKDLPTDTTLDKLTRQFERTGTRVAGVLWECYVWKKNKDRSLKRTAGGQEAAKLADTATTGAGCK